MHRKATYLLLGCLAFAGVGTAHALSFLLAAPDSHHRDELLSHTGHGPQWLMLTIVTGFLVAAASIAIAVAISNRSSVATRHNSFTNALPRLIGIQVIAFLALEGTERLLAQGTVANLVHEPVFFIGLGMQVVVAVVGALLVATLLRAVRYVLARTRCGPAAERPRPFVVTFVEQHFPTTSIATSGYSLRGPPATSST